MVVVVLKHRSNMIVQQIHQLIEMNTLGAVREPFDRRYDSLAIH